jgi:hypothetical protein
MGDLKQQHVCIRFCFKRGKSDAETFEMRQVALESRQFLLDFPSLEVA